MPLPGTTAVTPLGALIEAAVQNMYGAWTPLTSLTGYTSEADVRTAPGEKIELRGKVTAISGDIARGAGVANLPVGFRPTVLKHVTAAINVSAGEGPGTVSVVIQTSGNLLVESGTSYIDGNILYLDGISLAL